jgi:hypothetical protein
LSHIEHCVLHLYQTHANKWSSKTSDMCGWNEIDNSTSLLPLSIVLEQL